MKKTIKSARLFFLFLLVFTATITYAQSEKELFDKGVLLFKKGAYVEAVDVFTELIEVAPEHADAFKNRGVSYMKLEKYDQAIKDFQKAKELFPELKGLYSNLGVAWYYKKSYEKAIENYDIELEMAPDNYIAYFNRALCLAELDKHDRALEDLDKTLEIKPDFYWAICYKADLLVIKGENTAARKLYEEAVQVNSQKRYARKKLAALKRIMPEISAQQPKNDPKSKQTKKQPQDLVKKEPVAVEKSTASQTSGFAIQSGAFMDKTNADRMKIKLNKLGFDTRVLSLEDSKEKTWYLIRTGRYTTKADAQKDFERIQKVVGSKPVIRPIGTW